MQALEQALQQHGFSFEQLHSAAGLAAWDAYFLQHIQQHHPKLHHTLLAYRRSDNHITAGAESEFLIACARVIQLFLSDVFAIKQSVAQQKQQLESNTFLFEFKYKLLKRVVKKAEHALDTATIEALDFASLQQQLNDQVCAWEATEARRETYVQSSISLEQRIARWALAVCTTEKLAAYAQFSAAQRLLANWCLAARHTAAGRAATAGWISLSLPANQDFNALVPYARDQVDGQQYVAADQGMLQARDGFDLNDSYLSVQQQQDETHYCILCHPQQGDFCSRGFPQKKSDPGLGLRQNPLQTTLTGCPLQQRISEMHLLAQTGDFIAALAMIMRDNPLCALTGQRICNDCMQACIYQKQQPVDIPQTETGILLQVLDLPWGVELYHLLSLWNPLRPQQWCYAAANGYRVLIMGLGPAGISLAHHLTMAGCYVTAADGLKIEKLDAKFYQSPVRDFKQICCPLSQRPVVGLGGVAEYGITARWDKNFLTLIYMNLIRRRRFQLLDAVRFGGQITVEKAWALGFDHLTIAVGAGLPRALPVAQSLAPGMRQANDFLMSLHLNAAYQFESLVNLQVALPAVVIGAGLTAVDSACELQAYYIVQVEQLAQRCQRLQQHFGLAHWQQWQQQLSLVQQQQLEVMLEHAQAITEERALAAQQQRAVNFIDLIHAWGGVSLVYRQGLEDSPAYKTNHQELTAALAQGIIFREGLQPLSVLLDASGHCRALQCQTRVQDENDQWRVTDQTLELAARCILVATGAQPNVAYEFEHRGTFQRAQQSYERYNLAGTPLQPTGEHTLNEEHCKKAEVAAFTSYQQQDKQEQHQPGENKRVTFIGDTHPLFHGSVVKAIASGQRIYPQIMQHVAELKAKSVDAGTTLPSDAKLYAAAQQLHQQSTARIVSLQRLNQNTLKLQVKAPLAAAAFYPGVFYRVQSYVADAYQLGDTICQNEPLALMASAVPQDPQQLSFIVREDCLSARMVASWKVGQALALMGPTGAKAGKSLYTADRLLLLGDYRAAIYLYALGPSIRKLSPQKVVQAVLSYASLEQVFCVEELRQLSDSIVWCIEEPVASDRAQAILRLRPQDTYFHGSAAQYLAALATGNCQLPEVSAQPVRQVLTIAGSALVCDVNRLRQQQFWPQVDQYIAAAYGPMQCMLKGICAQCLQWQLDPATGERTKAVYACSWQHQPLQLLDLQHLQTRQNANNLLEPLHQLWLDYILELHTPTTWC